MSVKPVQPLVVYLQTLSVLGAPHPRFLNCVRMRPGARELLLGLTKLEQANKIDVTLLTKVDEKAGHQYVQQFKPYHKLKNEAMHGVALLGGQTAMGLHRTEKAAHAGISVDELRYVMIDSDVTQVAAGENTLTVVPFKPIFNQNERRAAKSAGDYDSADATLEHVLSIIHALVDSPQVAVADVIAAMPCVIPVKLAFSNKTCVVTTKAL